MLLCIHSSLQNTQCTQLFFLLFQSNYFEKEQYELKINYDARRLHTTPLRVLFFDRTITLPPKKGALILYLVNNPNIQFSNTKITL